MRTARQRGVSHARRWPVRLAWSFTMLMSAGMAACGGDAPQGPPAVARVVLNPSRPNMSVGETVRLRASVEDAAGKPITDREPLWSTDAPDVAMVSQRGEVTGNSAGTVTITASVGGQRGSAQVTVVSRTTIAAISPDPMIEGQSALITGQGFDPVPSNNRVTVDGIPATVLQASDTRLTITVPVADCRPARRVEVSIATAADPRGRTINSSVRPPASVSVPVGRQVMVRDPAKFCLQFAPGAGDEAYLVGVTSTAESSKLLTGVKVEGVSPTTNGAPVLAPEHSPARMPFAPSADQLRDTELARRHQAAEAQLRAGDREVFERARRMGQTALRPAPGQAAALTFPATLAVGNVVDVRVPGFGSGCTTFTPIRAAVRVVGKRGIWLEDVANPAGGYGAAELQALSNLFDAQILDADVDYFGALTDVDRNGRVAIVITKEVNRAPVGANSFLLGFVAAADLVSRNACVSSNEGEVFYGRTPDASGALGYPLGVASLLRVAPRNITHELVHIIQFGHRLYGGSGNPVWPSIWESEGQATLAEEVMGFRVEGRLPGRNYGGDVVTPVAGALHWYDATIDMLGLYYGWQPEGARIPNAPEQCSWLDRTSQGNTGPCWATDLLSYGVGWLFLRWLSDQFGPGFPGGEKGLQRALVDLDGAGFGPVARLVGVPSDSLLGMFAAMQYVDDRVPGALPRLTLPSWNLPSVLHRSSDQQLVPRERAFNAFTDVVSVRGASTAYFRISGARSAGTSIRVSATDGTALPAHMRLWVVRLR